MARIRNDVLVRDLDTAMGRALEGAAYLDKRFGPSWVQAIDVERLDIGSAFNCVLAQVSMAMNCCIFPGIQQSIAGGFSNGLLADLLSVCGYRSAASARSYDLLAAAWKVVIAGRLAKQAPMSREATTAVENDVLLSV